MRKSVGFPGRGPSRRGDRPARAVRVVDERAVLTTRVPMPRISTRPISPARPADYRIVLPLSLVTSMTTLPPLQRMPYVVERICVPSGRVWPAWGTRGANSGWRCLAGRG